MERHNKFPKDDARPPNNGWAPGTYYCRCFTCGEAFVGDKRATKCADCAYRPTTKDRT